MSDDHTHVQEFFSARVLDADRGAGHALTPLRAAVGPSGVVLGAGSEPLDAVFAAS